MRRRDMIAATAGAFVATVLTGSIAWAAIPGDGSAYSACMLKNIGTVRLIDKSLPPNHLMSHCKPALEVEVSWNQKGQQGLQGLPGASGANGEDGAQGPKGDKGDPGQNGADGTPGERGPQGEQGLPGQNGAPGAQGAPGQPGGLSGYERVFVCCQFVVSPGTDVVKNVDCPAGKLAISGGWEASPGFVPWHSIGSGGRWEFWFHNDSAANKTVSSVMAVCVNSS